MVFFPVIVSGQDFIDFFRRSHNVGHGNVMIHKINDGCQELAHIGLGIIGPGVKLRRLIGEVGGDYPVEPAVFIGLVEGLKAIGEQSEGTADENTLGIHFLQLSGGIQHAFSGGNHIVNNDNVLSVNAVSQEFMGDDGVLAVYNGGIIAAFVEHAGIDAEYIAEI